MSKVRMTSASRLQDGRVQMVFDHNGQQIVVASTPSASPAEAAYRVARAIRKANTEAGRPSASVSEQITGVARDAFDLMCEVKQ